MMDIKIYAPVIIPTLNRYDHFKQCLESLEKCTGAENTDVYIALDYPPCEKYKEGWEKINSYLKQKENCNRFKKLVIYRNNYNYGLHGHYTNWFKIIECVLRNYDRHIVSEDDNVFSPNFLEYINKGLELYKNDPRVVAICGYKNDFECMSNGNNHFAQHSLFQAWGYGIWTNRYVNARETLTPSYFKRIFFSYKKWRKCYYYWPHWTASMIRSAMSTGNHLPTHDTNMGFYLINEKKCVICPTVSKVRNMGFCNLANTTNLDQGNLKGRAKHENNLMIDQELNFEFIGNPFQFEEENSFNIARWDGKWETDRMRSLWRIYPRIIAFRILALLGIV